VHVRFVSRCEQHEASTSISAVPPAAEARCVFISSVNELQIVDDHQTFVIRDSWFVVQFDSLTYGAGNMHFDRQLILRSSFVVEEHSRGRRLGDQRCVRWPRYDLTYVLGKIPKSPFLEPCHQSSVAGRTRGCH
jgi:hypothetical protein